MPAPEPAPAALRLTLACPETLTPEKQAHTLDSLGSAFGHDPPARRPHEKRVEATLPRHQVRMGDHGVAHSA